MARRKYVQIESKNAMLELLKAGREFARIFIANNAYKDPKTKEIISEAGKRRVPVTKVARRELIRRARTQNAESVIGLMYSGNNWDLDTLLDDLFSKKESPFFLLFDHLKYSLNIGAIMRTAFGGFVNGVITPIKKEAFLTDESMRISVGACERIPIIEMNLFAALKKLREEDIRIIALETGGKPYFQSDLTGPVAFVIGAEDTGISNGILDKCDSVVSIPMREGIGSLNVGVSTGILIYEKVRQETEKAVKASK